MIKEFKFDIRSKEKDVIFIVCGAGKSSGLCLKMLEKLKNKNIEPSERLKNLIKNIAVKHKRSIIDVTKEMESSIPANRFAEPTETANAVAFLSSDQASYINGASIPVDGGKTQSL